MKHLTKIFLLGTAVLAAAACQREPLMSKQGDDSEKQDVVVDLVLNVLTGRNASTKMTDANVQRANNFLGIQDAVIIPFETGYKDLSPSPKDHYVTLNPGHTEGNQFYDLGNLYTSGMIPGGEGGTNADKSRRVVQLSIPLGTDAMLFYGKAYNQIISTGNPVTDAENLVQNRRNRGALLDNIKSATPTQPGDIHFNLVSRLTGNAAQIPATDEEMSSYEQTARLMEYILNYVIYEASLPGINSYHAPAGGDTYQDLPPISWRELAASKTGTTQLKPIEDILATAYIKTMSVEENEYRGASSYAVSLIMQDLADIVDAILDAVPTSIEEANAIRLAELCIEPRINMFFNSADEYHYKQKSVLKTNLTTDGKPMTEAAFEAAYGKAKEPNEFPYEAFRIPEGAAQMAISNEGKIVYCIPNRALLHPETKTDFPPYKYTYPAELAYYVNSPLLVTSEKVEDSDTYFPNGYNKWYNQYYWNELELGWKQNFVGTETKGVAIRDNVNYGVALLETNVAYSSDVTTYVLDNRGHFSPQEGNAQIPLSSLSLELYGVLVGGQNVEVNWQYLSTTDNEDNYSFVTYDDVMETTRGAVTNANYVKPGGTVKNYTLVLDNYIAKETQLDVPIALEFINRGVDFWGRDNLIRTGATFYLLGKLRPYDETEGYITHTIDWSITEDQVTGEGESAYISRYGYQVPPTWGVGSEAVPDGKVRGKSKKIDRVFVQNFTTKANFKIGVNSLKNAYVTLPDLRSSQMSLGLSVDLSWEQGLEFNVEL